MATRLLAVCGLVSLVAFPLLACDHDTPARASGSSTVNPTTPTANAVVSVVVGTAGSLSATLAPGEIRQLFALAKYTNDTTSDVTNRAAWQSSNPVVATVSSGGVLTAAAEGSVDVTATYENVPGSFHADVRPSGCDRSTISPAALSYNEFGQGSTTVQVTTPLSDCRWTARSDSDWLRFQYDPGRSGSGGFSYSVPPNNYPDARTAHILVNVGGTQLVHTVTQDRPAACSFVLTPDDGYFTANGGTGFFDVSTSPAACQWRASATSYLGVQITSGTSGTGSARVTYHVDSNPYSYPRNSTISVAGLTGASPSGVHKIHVPSR